MFVAVTKKRDVGVVAGLARGIWREYYTPIIGAGQVAFMLEKFQSVAAISRRISCGDWYFLIYFEGRAVGYIGLERRRNSLFLSKLYLVKSVRGKGLGRRAVAFVFAFAAARGLSAVRLTVNRHNVAAIAAYQRTGFTCVGKAIADIGGGYVMDDYVFVRRVADAGRAPIRDAASLILVRCDGDDAEVLLGRRAASNRFMPGMYVFPGGVLQPEDFHAQAHGSLRDSCAKLMGVRGDYERAAALAKTAIRETAEECGVMLAVPGAVGDDVRDPGWRDFHAAGLRPSLRELTYLGRALTPVGMPLRYNARFFVAPASVTVGTPRDGDELDDLQWRRPADCRDLPMVDITIYLLARFPQILERAKRRQAFVFRHHRERAVVKWQSVKSSMY